MFNKLSFFGLLMAMMLLMLPLLASASPVPDPQTREEWLRIFSAQNTAPRLTIDQLNSLFGTQRTG
ncbi:hypothetical protein HK102_011655 [Quaeritorhiza haematococci]|nr:hypothetical protein HK102_011655 [Quaeritorhiza haematococci]